MDRNLRKAALTEYRERKPDAGIFAVRCAASGEAWVGRAPGLAAIRNRVFFELRQGSSKHRGMQAAWNAHGADSFSFEVLEQPDEDVLGLSPDRALKALQARWAQELGAATL
jgi:hypothetical protein